MTFALRFVACVAFFLYVASAVPIETPQSSPLPTPAKAITNKKISFSVRHHVNVRRARARTEPTAAVGTPLTIPEPIAAVGKPVTRTEPPSTAGSAGTAQSQTQSRATGGAPSSVQLARECGRSDWSAAKRRMRALIEQDSERARWPGRLLRAGFHDCYEGSCDASIAHELDRVENTGIEATLDLIQLSVRGTCVSLSDAIKIGLELSMELMGAPELSCPKGNIRDATEAGRKGEIPFPSDDATTILFNFRRKGFTVEEAMAGNFGGHSVGRFGGNNFTPTVSRYGNEFARFMTGSIADPTGFNSLESDRDLLAVDAHGVVQRFASDKARLDLAFASFMDKLCSLE